MRRSPGVILCAGILVAATGRAPVATAPAAGQKPPVTERAVVAVSIPYSPGRALPDKLPGWTRSRPVTMFGPSSLWEHINGAAEQYLVYEFQDLATAAYTRAAGGTATVEIYRMLDPVHAYGIYAQELSPAAGKVAVGVEGRAGKNSLKFWSSDFYVKVVSPPGSTVPPADLFALAGAVAAGLGAPGKPPAQLAWFPRASVASLLADSIRFVPADALGQSMFANAFEAKYAGTPESSTLVIVPYAGVDAARGALAKYASFLGRPGKPAKALPKPGDGGFVAQDGYYGIVLAVRAGTYIVISLGAPSETHAATLVADAVRRLPPAPAAPAAPAAPKGKGDPA